MCWLESALTARKFSTEYAGHNDPVFADAIGRPLQQRSVQRWFDLSRDAAKRKLKRGYVHDDGKPVTFHDLRHAFASRCASRGVPVGVLSSIMGHANVGITQTIYTHLYGREEAEAAFREAMNGAAVVKSLSSSDPEHPELTGETP